MDATAIHRSTMDVASRTSSRGTCADPADEHNRRYRSAVTNGKRLFVDRPGDTAWSRRFRDVLNQILDDITPSDGRLSEGQRQLARRAATLCITCEKLEGTAATGADIDLEVYGKITDRLGRAFHRLGLKPVSSSNGPTLGDLIRADQAAQRQQPKSNGA